MNIFVLDRMPNLAAQYAFDAHIRSGIIENCSMMGFAYNDGDFAPWKWLKHSNKHFNHPSSKWTRESRQNFDWLLQHSYALCEEFEFRFGKKHKCLDYVDWIARNIPIDNLDNSNQTDFPRCFGEYKEDINITNDAVQDYRNYYMLAKRHLEKYTKRNLPFWYR